MSETLLLVVGAGPGWPHLFNRQVLKETLAMSLNISWLESYPSIESLLSRHTATARVLGASQQREDEFIRRAESADRSIQAFRGLQGQCSSPFRVEPPHKFRGLQDSPAEYDVRLERPPFAPPSEKAAHSPESDEEKRFAYAGRVHEEDDTALDENAALEELLQNDPELRDAFISGNHQLINEKLSQAAKDSLAWSPSVTSEFLNQHPDEALMIAADIGGISDILAEPGAAESLTGDVRQRLEDEIFDRLAQEAAKTMRNSTVLDEAFFREHPKAALYLMNHPEERRRIDGHVQAEEEFRNHVASYEALVDTVERAEELAGDNVALGKDFWQDNPGLALAMWAEKAGNGGNSLQVSSLGFPEELFQETTPSELIERDQARRALQTLGDVAPIDLSFVSKHPQLSRLINENPQFAENLSKDPKVADFLGTDNSRIERTLRAYASGIPGRNELSWHWWA